MNRQALIVLTVLMWIVALSHLVIGGALVGPEGLRDLVATAYGADATWSPQFSYILKPLGVFMLALGVIGVMAARRPLEHRLVVVVFALLLAARVVQRLMYTTEITEAFAITSSRTYLNAGVFALLAVLILVSLIIAGGGNPSHAASTDPK